MPLHQLNQLFKGSISRLFGVKRVLIKLLVKVPAQLSRIAFFLIFICYLISSKTKQESMFHSIPRRCASADQTVKHSPLWQPFSLSVNKCYEKQSSSFLFSLPFKNSLVDSDPCYLCCIVGIRQQVLTINNNKSFIQKTQQQLLD